MGKHQVPSVVRKNPFRNIRYAGYQSLGHSIVFKWHHVFQTGEVLLIGDVQKKYPTTHTE
jgi:hypothetical protein